MTFFPIPKGSLPGGFPMPRCGQLAVAIGATPQQMIAATAVLSLQGPVRVVVGGNRFNAHQLARAVRRHTTQLDAALSRVTVARGFTCYQVAALLAEVTENTAVSGADVSATAVSPPPLLVCDLLSTFADEAVATVDAFRLLRQVVGHLQTMRTRGGAVLVSLTPPPQPDRTGLVATVTAVADVSYHLQSNP